MQNISLRLMKVALFITTFSYMGAVYSDENVTKALFIGNSLSYSNNLPVMISDIAKYNGDELVFETYAPGGEILKNHADNPVVLKAIESDSWNFVVLQEQSQRPGFSKHQVAKDVFPYAKKLSEKVRDVNNSSKVVFYMTMARRNGDPDNKHVSSELLTYEGMQNRINRSYIEMGKANRAKIAPVGEVWSTIRKENPDINLYADEIHPNLTGTYLTACVFYATFFEKSSIGSKIPTGVDRATGEYIQSVVDRIVLDPNGKWDFENYEAASLGISEMLFFIFLTLLFLLVFVLPWLMALLSKKAKGHKKLAWFVLSFLFSWIGYVGYYIFGVRGIRS